MYKAGYELDHSNGFNRGELNIFAGGSGCGKSLFFDNLGVNRRTQRSILDLCCEIWVVLPEFDAKIETVLDCAAKIAMEKHKTGEHNV